MEDHLTVRQACGCLANLSENKDTHPFVLGDWGVGYLCELVTHKDVALVREVTRCLTNLAGNYECHARLVEPKGPDALLLAEQAAAAAAEAAAKAAAAQKGSPKKVGSGGTPGVGIGARRPQDGDAAEALVTALRADDAITCRFAALGIVNLTAVPANQPAFLELGAHEVLIELACGEPRTW